MSIKNVVIGGKGIPPRIQTIQCQFEGISFLGEFYNCNHFFDACYEIGRELRIEKFRHEFEQTLKQAFNLTLEPKLTKAELLRSLVIRIRSSIRDEISQALFIYNLENFSVEDILTRVRQYGEQLIQKGESINVSTDWIKFQAERIIKNLVKTQGGKHLLQSMCLRIIDTPGPLDSEATSREESGNLNLSFHNQSTQRPMISTRDSYIPGSSMRGSFRKLLMQYENNAQNLRSVQHYWDFWFPLSETFNCYSSFNESKNCSRIITIDFEAGTGKTNSYLPLTRQKLEGYYFPSVFDEFHIWDRRYRCRAIGLNARKFNVYQYHFLKSSWELNLTTSSVYIPVTSTPSLFERLSKSYILLEHLFVRIAAQVYQSTFSDWLQQISVQLWNTRRRVENLKRSISNQGGIITLITAIINNTNVQINGLDVVNFARKSALIGRLIQYEGNTQHLLPILIVINEIDFVLVWKRNVFVESNYSHKTLYLTTSNELSYTSSIFLFDFVEGVYVQLFNIAIILNIFNILLERKVLNFQVNKEYSKPLQNDKLLADSLEPLCTIFLRMNLINNIIMSISNYFNNAHFNKSFSNSKTLSYSRKAEKAILVNTVLE
ncbi:hypothetical protein [Nostoc sp. FACHB-190]|uniref:hypothetical protein n=1 Tax=Nostoc sp. FACHB-190 TaxID=2692838 RepID=UPI001683E834|nr:hypothetical protein [Nostoc sp. FACHB-190]MBD2303583.1 hypothetical protein [Nostoc sp. FACHB-190]